MHSLTAASSISAMYYDWNPNLRELPAQTHAQWREFGYSGSRSIAIQLWVSCSSFSTQSQSSVLPLTWLTRTQPKATPIWLTDGALVAFRQLSILHLNLCTLENGNHLAKNRVLESSGKQWNITLPLQSQLPGSLQRVVSLKLMHGDK